MNQIELDIFVAEHCARHPLARLPKPGSAMGMVVFGAWNRAFESMRVTPEIARAASERLMHQPPDKPSKHWTTLREYCKEAMQAIGSSTRTNGYGDTREEAEAASKDCLWCDGAGLVAVWHPSPSHDRKIPETVAAHCGCRMGRWIRRQWTKQAPDAAKKTPDLVDIHNGRSVWLAVPPWLTEDTDNRPLFREYAPRTYEGANR